jgi:hypothetical protein
MSTPEEIQSQTESTQPMNVASAIGQLRVLTCGLGVGLILVSLVLSAFMIKQTRDISAATGNREHQIAQLQVMQKPTMALLTELAKYSQGKPELTAIFTKRGLQFTPPGAAVPPR